MYALLRPPSAAPKFIPALAHAPTPSLARRSSAADSAWDATDAFWVDRSGSTTRIPI
jgi:hypothetical protein